MKNFRSALLVFGVWCLVFAASAQVRPLLLNTTDNIVTTNTFAGDVLDLSEAATVAVQVNFTGQGRRTTTALVGVTNITAGADVLQLTLAGTARRYYFTNSPTTNVAVLSAAAPVVKIGLIDLSTNGQTLTLILNARTNTYTFTNSAAAVASPLLRTNSAVLATTNLFEVLKAELEGGLPATRSVAVSYLSATLLQLQAQVNDRFEVATAEGWATNQASTVYTVTNTVATNLLHLRTNSAALSTTNLYALLTADYGSTLGVSYAGATLLQLQTPFGDGFTLTNSANLGTNQIITNAITGNVLLLCSNSLDRVTWFRDGAHDISLAYSTTAAIGWLTNFTVGPYLYWTYRVENAAGNYANPASFKFQYAVKRGL